MSQKAESTMVINCLIKLCTKTSMKYVIHILFYMFFRFASPEELQAFEESLIDLQPSSRHKSLEKTGYYPDESLIDMKFISPNSIRDLVDMYRIKWQHTQQTGVRDAEKWRHLMENTHKNVHIR